jgi:hypothetical protein
MLAKIEGQGGGSCRGGAGAFGGWRTGEGARGVVAGLDRIVWREWAEVRFVRVERKVDARAFAVEVSVNGEKSIEEVKKGMMGTDLGRSLSSNGG